ncbi:MAG: peptide ABC transporter substrate-binding protein [Thermoguttaceae bacterium]|nr:peptide ABC transporter substrate-binding protein [Thermoguttaceae bacterium]
MKRTITALFLLSFVLIVGCEFPDDEAPQPNNSNENAAAQSEDASADEQPAAAGETKKDKIVLGNMLEPFTPPTLEELNAQAEKQGGWVVNPVKDGSKLVYQYLNGEPAPTTVEEALKLENDSPENNNKIRHTLGRLPENEAKEVDYNQTVIRQSPSDAKSVNPIMMSSVTEFDLANLMSIGIMSHTYDTMESYAPQDTVREWKTMPDRYCDMFVLRDDITWSDGEPFTAYDIEFSFKLIMTREVPTPAMRSGTDQIKACVAYDKNTLVFFHKEPLVTNTLNMNFAVIPKHIYEKTWALDPSLTGKEHIKWENDPVVAGPYKITKRVTNQYIELEAREDYYMYKGKQVREKPYFKKVRIDIIPSSEIALMAMKRGDLDYMQIDFNQWDTQTSGPEFYTNCTKVQAVEWTSFHFCWNLKTQYFEDVRVRKAMSYAFNYKEMFDVILFNLAEPSCGIYHPLNPAFPKDAKPPYEQDLVKAIQLLKEAGWEDHDGDGLLDKYVTAGAMIHNNEIFIVKGGKRVPLSSSWTFWGGKKGKEIVAKDGTRYVVEADATFIVDKDGKKTEVKQGEDTIVLNADHILLTNGQKMELPKYYLPFEFTLYCNNSSSIALQICELMMQCLKSIGVACNVRPVEFTTLMQKEQCHEFEAALGGWGAGTDPDTSENIWKTGKDRNYGYYSNAEVDELFFKGKRETDRAKRMEIYGRIHNIIYDEQPYTFLYCRNAFYAVSKRIRGYGFYPRGLIEGNIWVPKEEERQ